MKLYKKLAKTYGVNEKALKRKMKVAGVSTKEIQPLPILEVIYENSYELMYTRATASNRTFEFMDTGTLLLLIRTITGLRKISKNS